MVNILPAITTITPGEWRNKIKEINGLKIKEAALFLTCIKKDERAELYGLLEKTKLKRVPFVHLRTDMSSAEIDYLIKRWSTEVFNIHTPRQYAMPSDWERFRSQIYIENTVSDYWLNEELDTFGGVCIDFSHLEMYRLENKPEFDRAIEIIEQYPCGCAHISAIRKNKEFDSETGKIRFDFHWLNDLSEVDYLKKFPISYFPKWAALELENDLRTQLQVKRRILEILPLNG